MVRCAVLGTLSLCLTACGDAPERPVATIVAEVRKADLTARRALVRELQGHSQAIAGWRQLLVGPAEDHDCHVLAAGKLGAMGAAAAPAIPELIEALRRGYPGLKFDASKLGFRVPDAGRKTAREALRRIGKPAVPALIELLSDAEPLARKEAALTLSQIGPDAAAAVDALLGRLRPVDPHKDVAAASAWALGEIGVADAKVQDVLLAAATDVDALVRMECLRAIGKFGVKAMDKRDAVRAFVGDTDAGVRRMAEELLEALPLPGSGDAPIKRP